MVYRTNLLPLLINALRVRKFCPIVAHDGFALWCRASTAAYKSSVFVRSGMPIPDGSIAAFGSAAQYADDDQAIALPAGIWTFIRGSEPVR